MGRITDFSWKKSEIEHELSKKSWWHRARQDLLKQEMDAFCSGNSVQILDVGCGIGTCLGDFSRYGTAIGIDISKNRLGYCAKKKLGKVALADAANMPFKSQSFDFAFCLNTIYHESIENEACVLLEINRVLKNNGKLFLFESAFNSLRRNAGNGYMDKRYRKKELQNMLEKTGFSVIKISYWNMLLLPFILVFRGISKAMGAKGNRLDKKELRLKLAPKPVGWLLYRLLLIENRVLRRHNLPFGSSIFCIAEKKLLQNL